MKRECYFCGKKLKIEQRASMFCGLRCQELYRTLRERPPGEDTPASAQQLALAPRPAC